MSLNKDTNMSKLAFLAIAALIAIFSLSVFANTFAKSSSGDSRGNDKSGHKKDDGGSHLAAPGSPVVVAKNKHKEQKNDDNTGGLAAPGSPVAVADSGNGNDGGSNNGGYGGHIKKFDTSKSSFRIGGSNGKVVQYMPGFNETFYNSTLPYCFAVLRGSCYDSSTGQIIP